MNGHTRMFYCSPSGAMVKDIFRRICTISGFQIILLNIVQYKRASLCPTYPYKPHEVFSISFLPIHILETQRKQLAFVSRKLTAIFTGQTQLHLMLYRRCEGHGGNEAIKGKKLFFLCSLNAEAFLFYLSSFPHFTGEKTKTQDSMCFLQAGLCLLQSTSSLTPILASYMWSKPLLFDLAHPSSFLLEIRWMSTNCTKT